MLNKLKKARLVSTPLIAIKTNDPIATAAAIVRDCNGIVPVLEWNAVDGLAGLNKLGKDAAQRIIGELDQSATTSPVEVLGMASKLPQQSILLMFNLQLFLGGTNTDSVALLIQAIMNLRDQFKSNRRTLVNLGVDINLPVELAQDFLVLDEPLPDDDRLQKIVTAICSTVPEMKKPTPEVLIKAVNALRGLSAFPAEQAVAMSLALTGIDLEGLWERKRKLIEATKGLVIWRGKESFDQVHGLDNMVDYVRSLLPEISCVLYFDEIEKMVAGAQGDNTGVAQAIHQYLLTYMSDRDVLAILLLGPPGTGKSMVAKAAGNEAGAPCVSVDVNGVKAGIVGSSESNARALFKTIDAIGAGKVLMIATCNNIDTMSPELLSRFLDTFFVELPVSKAKKAMWKQYSKEFKLAEQQLPDDTDWTGREIRKCCKTASLRKVSLVESARYIVPIAVREAARIKSLRQRASGKYVSASESGLYQYQETEKQESKPVRSISLG